MKKAMVLLALAGLCHAASAVAWKGLTDRNHCSGPKITEADLLGKVVLVDMWGVNCPPCLALLPKMEDVWRSFKSKPFMLIGSHCQGGQPERVAELVKANKLTYPIYYGYAGLAENEPQPHSIPFMYVVNHRGKVVYSGRVLPDAIEAVVNALGAANGEYDLTGSVILRKYKPLAKQLVLGKSIKSPLRKLRSDIKRAQAKSASAAMKAQAEEAEDILAEIDKVGNDVKADIEILKTNNPPKALKLVKAFMTTFPEEGAAYKGELTELAAKAREWTAAQKAK